MATITLTIAASADDTNRFRNSNTDGGGYPPVTTPGGNQDANATLTPRKAYFPGGTGPGGAFWQTHVIFLRFNSSVIGERSIVSSASLIVNIEPGTNTDGRNVLGEWYRWTSAPTDSDFAETVGSTAFTKPVSDFIGLPVHTDVTIPLNSTTSNINTTGYTGLRLGVSGGQPTNDNIIFINSFDSAQLKPRLSITYSEISSDNFGRPVSGRGASW